MADTKNFGLKGVGNDIQLGKAGPRINLSGSVIQARNAADGAYVIVRGLDPVGANDLTTKSYVDSVAAGLDPKESCQAATVSAGIGTYAAGGGAGGTGQFTGVAASIDGVTLAEGDRVLVKDQASATQNGIYVVTSTTTTLDRASDHDGSPAAEVSAGNFTFVEGGTVNAGTGWVLQGDGVLTLNTNNLDWVQFSGSGTYTAGTGLTLTGTTFDLDFSELTSASTIALADELIFQDGTVESRITVTNFLADRDIVTATANGIITRTANDTYASRTLTASAVAGDEGISIVNGDGVSGNPTIGLDITGLAAIGTVQLADTIVVFDGANNVEATFTDVVEDLDIPNAITTNGMVTRTAADTYTSRSIAVSAVAGDEGLSIVNGDGVSGNPTVGLDILGQTNLVTDDVDDADELIIYHSVAGGTEGVGNYAITAAKLKTYMNADTSSTSITEGDSTLAVSDSGTDGTLTWTADGVVVLTIDDTVATFSNGLDISMGAGSTLTIADLTENDVMVVGASGLIEDSGGNLTFSGTQLGVTGSIVSSTLTDNRVLIAGTAGLIEDDGNFTFNGTTLALTAGMDITGDLDVDNVNVNGNTISVTDADGSLTIIPNDVGQITLGTGAGTEILELQNTVSIISAQTETDYDNSPTTEGTFAAGTGYAAAEVITMSDGSTITVDTVSTGNVTEFTVTTGSTTPFRLGTTLTAVSSTAAGNDDFTLTPDFANVTATTAVNGLAILPGATGAAPTIRLGTGSETNVDIGFVTNGTGVLSVVAGSGNYEDNVTAADDIPNKQYVDDAVAGVTVDSSGTVDTVTGSVDLTTASAQNIGAADGIPANATILSVLLDVTTASDAVTTVTVGDATNGAAAYMAASENDPEVQDIYIADGRLLNGGAARQARATVATAGSTGAATCIITFRHA